MRTMLSAATGPDRSFEATVDAAPHHHRSGHSCIAQHFQEANFLTC